MTDHLTIVRLVGLIVGRRPGTLPDYVVALPPWLLSNPEVAAAVIRDALVAATLAKRVKGGWWVEVPTYNTYGEKGTRRHHVYDAAHGGDSLLSLFAGFCEMFARSMGDG